MKKPLPIAKALYTSLPVSAPSSLTKSCHRASIDGDMSVDSLTPGCQKASLSQLCLADGGRKRAPLRAEHHYPRQGAGRIFLLPSDRICRSDDAAEATNSTGAAQTEANDTMQHFSSISAVLEQYYASRNVYTAHPAEVRRPAPDCRHRLRPQPQEIPAAGKAVKGHGKA